MATNESGMWFSLRGLQLGRAAPIQHQKLSSSVQIQSERSDSSNVAQAGSGSDTKQGMGPLRVPTRGARIAKAAEGLHRHVTKQVQCCPPLPFWQQQPAAVRKSQPLLRVGMAGGTGERAVQSQPELGSG